LIHDVFYEEYSNCRQNDDTVVIDNDDKSDDDDDDRVLSTICLSEDYILMKMIETRPHLFHIMSYEESGVCMLWSDDRLYRM